MRQKPTISKMERVQTAVEFLIESIDARGLWTKELRKEAEQAKQMEKEQMIGLLNWMNEVSKVEPMRLETDHDDIVDQYYNETYGK